MKLNLISEYRKSHGISQKELAARLKISQQRLSYYENGMSPSAEFVSAFRKLTNIDLLDGHHHQPSALEYEIEHLKTQNAMLLQLVEEQKKRLAMFEKMTKT
jgi:transcriptional regulator with XRE-family HTH domain